MRILECSTRGCKLGKQFSAFNAKVTYNGKYASIEEHYQTSKSFNGERFNLKEAKKRKGEGLTGVFIFGKEYPPEMLTPFYYYLWALFYSENKDLVLQASKYDDYNDMFKGKSINCQADTLRMWIRDRASYTKILMKMVEVIKE